MKAKIFLCLITTLLSAGVGVAALRVMGVELRRQQQDITPLFQNDDRLGWSNIPGSRLPGITIDSDGHRATPDLPGRITLFLGCSFTWGYGVDDHESFAWKIGESRPVINASGCAYGPTQAYVILKDELKSGKRFDHVVYFFFRHHVLRTTINDHWQGYGPRWFPWLDESLMLHIDRHTQRERRDYLQSTDPAEQTLRIVRAMADLCDQHGQRFLIVNLPCPDYGERKTGPVIWPQIEQIAPTLDLSDTPGGWYVYHPDAQMHANIAERLAGEL